MLGMLVGIIMDYIASRLVVLDPWLRIVGHMATSPCVERSDHADGPPHNHEKALHLALKTFLETNNAELKRMRTNRVLVVDRTGVQRMRKTATENEQLLAVILPHLKTLPTSRFLDAVVFALDADMNALWTCRATGASELVLSAGWQPAGDVALVALDEHYN